MRQAGRTPTVAIPLIGGRPARGTWLGLFLRAHRDRPCRREVVLHLLGE